MVIGYLLLVNGEVIRSFEQLDCWRACRELRRFVVRCVAPKLGPDEKYRLADQMLRAARSTTANLAEGYGRFHYADNAKFCSNARGSAYEVLDHLITAADENFIDETTLAEGRKLVETSTRLINGYIRYLKKAAL